MTAATSSERQLDRRNLRRASALLDEAGWIVGDDGMRRNSAGDKLRVEILNDSQAFDRVINPYVENLRALGVDAVHTRIDNAQMTERERNFDREEPIQGPQGGDGRLGAGHSGGGGHGQSVGSEHRRRQWQKLRELQHAEVERLQQREAA